MAKSLSGKYNECPTCNTSFYVPKHRIATAKYCSLSCKWKAESTAKTYSCATCGNDFTAILSRGKTAKYCSNSCKGKAYQNKNGSVENKCKCCNKVFYSAPSKKRVFCSNACASLGNRPETYKTAGGVRKSLQRRGLMTACHECGYNKHKEILGIHHINRDTSDNRLENIIILCPNCHSTKHMKPIVHTKHPN